jgi:hypothetical protein
VQPDVRNNAKSHRLTTDRRPTLSGNALVAGIAKEQSGGGEHEPGENVPNSPSRIRQEDKIPREPPALRAGFPCLPQKVKINNVPTRTPIDIINAGTKSNCRYAI